MDITKYLGETTEYDKKQEVECHKVKSWLKSVSAFANGNGGTLLFGIANNDTQGDTQGDTQDVPQGVPQDVLQGDKLKEWIKEQVMKNPKISTEDLAKKAGVASKTIKRHIAKMPHVQYIGSGYSGHWEVVKKEETK